MPQGSRKGSFVVALGKGGGVLRCLPPAASGFPCIVQVAAAHGRPELDTRRGVTESQKDSEPCGSSGAWKKKKKKRTGLRNKEWKGKDTGRGPDAPSRAKPSWTTFRVKNRAQRERERKKKEKNLQTKTTQTKRPVVAGCLVIRNCPSDSGPRGTAHARTAPFEQIGDQGKGGKKEIR